MTTMKTPRGNILTYVRAWAIMAEHKYTDEKVTRGFIGTGMFYMRDEFPHLEAVPTALFYTKKAATAYMRAYRFRDLKYWNGRRNRLVVVPVVGITTTLPKNEWNQIYKWRDNLIPDVGMIHKRSYAGDYA